MVKCHICSLETKQMNGLLSRHWKVHCNETYTKEQYKVDLYSANGRSQKHCKVCNKSTTIPKGESEYPDYHKDCYVKWLTENPRINPNWRGGKAITSCTHCNKDIEKHASMFNGKRKFCSIACSQTWYGLPENRTEAQKQNDILNSDKMKTLWKKPAHKAKMAKVRNDQGIVRQSRKETSMCDIVKTMYPDAVQSFLVKYYIFDCCIPSLNILIEFDGTYWHSLDATKNLDKRKTTYISRWHSHYKLIRVSELEWDDAEDKVALIRDALHRVD